MAEHDSSLSPPKITVEPIGLVRSPFGERALAPRQGSAGDAAATIELFGGRGFEDALEDLEGFERIWVVFWFDRNEGWKPKVLPPRSDKKRGVFATRSPYRPNAVGLSCVELVRIEGLTLHVRGVDMLDGTPVIDIKPYVAYADAFPTARAGWTDEDEPAPAASGEARDAAPRWTVAWSELAARQRAWLSSRGLEGLCARIEELLAVSPRPHAYRRIRPEGDGFRLAVKDFRVRFHLEGQHVTIDRISTGYRPSQLASDPTLELHRELVSTFG